MKKVLLKSLSLFIMLALTLTFAGCVNGGNTENSSLPTNSVNSTVTSSDNQLNEDTVKEIVSNYYDLLAHYNGSFEDFVDFFNLVDELKVDSKTTMTVKNEKYDIDVELWKTNVKYKDFKNQLLKYVSKSMAEEVFLRKDSFAEKDGYLYIAPYDGGCMSVDVLDAELLQETNGKYEYKLKCLDDAHDEVRKFDAKATIVKQNGVFVVDKCIEEIEE
jgi:hypothetical protein